MSSFISFLFSNRCSLLQKKLQKKNGVHGKVVHCNYLLLVLTPTSLSRDAPSDRLTAIDVILFSPCIKRNSSGFKENKNSSKITETKATLFFN
jgi:hypothetical protein